MTEQLHFQFSLPCIGEGNGNSLHCSCLENPRNGEAWWAAISGVTQSWTRLKRHSSSSSSSSSSVCIWAFPGSSAGKESTRNVGDPGWIPGSGRSAGEGIGNTQQYSWASLLAQMVKNPPAMWETWVRSLDWEGSLEKETATHCSVQAWRIPWTEDPGRVQSMGSQRVGHDCSLHFY